MRLLDHFCSLHGLADILTLPRGQNDWGNVTCVTQLLRHTLNAWYYPVSGLLVRAGYDPYADQERGEWVELPSTLFTAHLDTVHSPNAVTMPPYVEGSHMHSPSKWDCLGADDGAGVWLMLNMIRAGVRAQYLFTFDEERGGRGAQALLLEHPHWLDKVTHVIALDRCGTQDVITHQSGRRTASDACAKEIAARLGMGYAPSRDGVFSDAAIFACVIPECTNISVGYYDEHTPQESLDLKHLCRLRDRLCSTNWEGLPIARRIK